MRQNMEEAFTMHEVDTPGSVLSSNGDSINNSSWHKFGRRLFSRSSLAHVNEMPESDETCRTVATFRKGYRREEVEDDLEKKGFFHCDRKRAKNCLTSVFPCYNILRKYKWKSSLPQDAICGLTVGIMQLPQGMAYSMLAELPPVVGLYMSFFPVMIYFLLGSSKHISMGTVAVVSLLTGSVLARFNTVMSVSTTPPTFLNMTTNGSLLDDVTPIPDAEVQGMPLDVKLGIVATLSLLVGCTQILLGVLRLGIVTTYMSDALVAGFTTGTAVHVGTSQVKYIFGLKIPRTDGLFQVIKTYINIFERIGQTNIATFVTSVICIIIIYLVKVQVNQRFKHKLKIPIPVELLVVVAASLASYFAKFHENFHIKVVGNIPAGLPQPTVPSFEGIQKYPTDIFIIAVISFAQSVSLAALMAKKHRYIIDANQELIAYGFGNIFGSFFSCYPFAASVSRSSVQESAGGKSQIASLFSASLVLVVILWIGPLFEPLPNCVLSAIIVVALRSMILQVLELPKIWRTSKYDFMIWIVTCLCTTILHVDYGLLIGLVFSFFTVVIRTQRIEPTRLGRIADQKIYKDPRQYIKARTRDGVKIIGFSCPLYYANSDIFVKEVYRLSAVKPERLRKEIRRASQLHQDRRMSTITILPDDLEKGLPMPPNVLPRSASEINLPPFLFQNPIDFIIIDMSAIAFVDSVGCKVIKQLFMEYEAVNITIYLSGVSDDIWSVFEATEIIPKYEKNLFLTIDDAVTATLVKKSNEVNSVEKTTHM